LQKRALKEGFFEDPWKTEQQLRSLLEVLPSVARANLPFEIHAGFAAGAVERWKSSLTTAK
jgi:hypothetical protein